MASLMSLRSQEKCPSGKRSRKLDRDSFSLNSRHRADVVSDQSTRELSLLFTQTVPLVIPAFHKETIMRLLDGGFRIVTEQWMERSRFYSSFYDHLNKRRTRRNL